MLDTIIETIKQQAITFTNVDQALLCNLSSWSYKQ